jgi:NAD(P)-dependent dehydrogenase (short-subunit alcohol dehydrogenase family)/pimeloyl-ACP methyl ester carboxylesterase
VTRPTELRGALVLVTGAGSGIGRATALAFAREGARVLCADIDLVGAEKTAAACGEAGAREARGFEVDVSDPAAVAELSQLVHREHGVLDVLVNNAGVGMTGRFADMSIDDWRWIRGVNLDGVVHGCHAFGPAMVERGSGHVVNVSSGLGYTPRATESAYVATKAAVLAFSQSLRADWHGRVSVTAICPGVIDTSIVDATRFVGAAAEDRRARTKRLFRRGHTPEKVAKAIVRSARRSKAVSPVGIDAKLGRLAHRFAPSVLQEAIARFDVGSDTVDTSAMPGAELRIPTDDGAVLHATASGEGRLVVLAHCWTGSPRMWDAVTQRLVSGGHRVVRYEQRGHGRSSVGAEGLAIERVGRDLRNVLEHLDARDAIVAGHSLGGMVIQSLAITDPDVLRERVASVVLVATASDGLPSARLGRLAARLIGSPRLERVMSAPGGTAFVRRSLGPRARKADIAATRDAFVSTPARTRAELLTAMHAMDLTAASIEDATVVVGSRDRLTPPKLGRALAQRLRARVVELPDAGHMLPLERPDEVAGAISAAAGRRSALRTRPAAG